MHRCNRPARSVLSFAFCDLAATSTTPGFYRAVLEGKRAVGWRFWCCDLTVRFQFRTSVCSVLQGPAHGPDQGQRRPAPGIPALRSKITSLAPPKLVELAPRSQFQRTTLKPSNFDILPVALTSFSFTTRPQTGPGIYTIAILPYISLWFFFFAAGHFARHCIESQPHRIASSVPRSRRLPRQNAEVVFHRLLALEFLVSRHLYHHVSRSASRLKFLLSRKQPTKSSDSSLSLDCATPRSSK